MYFKVDVESVVFFAPATHLPYGKENKLIASHAHRKFFLKNDGDRFLTACDIREEFASQQQEHNIIFFLFFPDNLPADCYDIPRNFIRQLHKSDSAPERISGLVLTLPTLKIRSSGHQDLAICHDILRHPLTLPPHDQSETLPWILTADHTSVFTVWIGGDKKGIEVYFVLNPMCCRAMLASAKTSHSGNVSNQKEAQKATLDFALHTDFNPLTMNCSKKQVSLCI